MKSNRKADCIQPQIILPEKLVFNDWFRLFATTEQEKNFYINANQVHLQNRLLILIL
jgi:hypothetical protein